MCDLQRATVEFVAENRKTESLAAYYAQLTDAQRRALHAVAMDMWEAYIGATRDGLPNGDEKIVFDRFHIMREMTKAVDTVRKQEHRAFLRAGADSPLTGTKYLWLFSDERRPERHAEAFATLQALNLKVGRAWAIKEALRTLWKDPNLGGCSQSTRHHVPLGERSGAERATSPLADCFSIRPSKTLQ